MAVKRKARKARPGRSRKVTRRSKAAPSARVLARLRQELLLGAPKDPDELAPEVGRALRDELLRYAPAMPEEDRHAGS
jgi:hypothetical protein